MSTVIDPQAPNPEQAVAIDAGGTVFVSAGAGTERRPSSSSASCGL